MPAISVDVCLQALFLHRLRDQIDGTANDLGQAPFQEKSWNKSIWALRSNSTAKSTSLSASWSPRATEPNSDRRLSPAARSSASCARSVAITSSAITGAAVVLTVWSPFGAVYST